MVRYLIEFGYMGTKYKGLQKLPKYPKETIQGILERALEGLNPENEVSTSTCSRTDKGVHAFMNALHVDLIHKKPGCTFKPHVITDSLNRYLREWRHDITVSRTCVVPDEFHVRRCAMWRSYIYRLALVKSNVTSKSTTQENFDEFLPICEKNRCHVIPGSLDTERIHDNLNLFIGTQDYSTFTKLLQRENRNPIKTVYELKFYPSPYRNSTFDPHYQFITMWEFYIKADAFLYHQVRKMLGTVLSLGFGYTSPDDVRKMFSSPTPDNWRKAKLLPPDGLYLSEIHFNQECFNPNFKFNEVFEEQKKEAS